MGRLGGCADGVRVARCNNANFNGWGVGMKLGTIERAYTGELKLVCSGWVNTIGKVTLRHALDVYGFLVRRGETVKTVDLVKRIRAYQAPSLRRNILISALIASAWPRERVIPPRLMRAMNR